MNILIKILTNEVLEFTVTEIIRYVANKKYRDDIEYCTVILIWRRLA